MLPPGLSAGEIDAAVRERSVAGEGTIYELDTELLRELEPDLIVTQELCPVCAVTYDEVVKEAEQIAVVPEGDRARPQDDRRDDGRHPHRRRGDRRARRGARPRRPPARAHRPRPHRGQGRRAAAGRRDRVVRPGVHRRPLDAAADRARRRRSTCSASPASTPSRRPGRWSRPRSPRSSSCMPCGYDAAALARGGRDVRRASCAPSGARRVVAVDAAAYFSRPGPAPRRRPRAAGARAASRTRRAAGGRVRSARGPSSERSAHASCTCTPPAAATAPTASSSCSPPGWTPSATGRSSCSPTTASSPPTCASGRRGAGAAARRAAPLADVAARRLARRRGVGRRRRRARAAWRARAASRSCTRTRR